MHWTTPFLAATFTKMLSFDPSLTPATVGLQLHDPLPIWYCMTASDPRWAFTDERDLRVETTGQWTRGCCVVDRRGRSVGTGTGPIEEEVVGDAGGWRDTRRGNRVRICVGSLGVEGFAGEMLERVFGAV